MSSAVSVLSNVQVAPMLQARRARAVSVESSLDLGVTRSRVLLDEQGVRFDAAGPVVEWATLERIASAENSCFAVDAEGNAEAIKVYSDELDRLYTLMPTPRAPTMLVSGIPMHRIKNTDPVADTERKVAAVTPVLGRVLDTATGLGYTAIGAARAGGAVVTVELDPAVLEIARQNPWSRELFDNARIEQRIGDSAEIVPTFADASFDRVVHDPPMMSLAGQLFSGEFYRELYRVLRPRGRLFHYIGNPERTSGARTGKGVVRRLRDAGFQRVDDRPDAFGVVAYR